MFDFESVIDGWDYDPDIEPGMEGAKAYMRWMLGLCTKADAMIELETEGKLANRENAAFVRNAIIDAAEAAHMRVTDRLLEGFEHLVATLSVEDRQELLRQSARRILKVFTAYDTQGKSEVARLVAANLTEEVNLDWLKLQ